LLNDRVLLDGSAMSEDGRRKLINEQRSVELAWMSKEKPQD
jgi:hypothetical protein